MIQSTSSSSRKINAGIVLNEQFTNREEMSVHPRWGSNSSIRRSAWHGS